MKIFISHSSRDIEVCKKLTDVLTQSGYVVFVDSAIDVGKSMIETVKTALNDSDVLIAIITENFLNSSWAQAELSSAIFSTNNIRVLPVVVGDVFVPNFIAQFQYTKVKNEEEIISAVLTDIAKLSNIEDLSLIHI